MTLGWISIVRLGLVQMALGAVVVLTTSTLNRLMVVEMALPAVLPGLLVALHYGIQVTRPRWGFLSDAGGRRDALDHRRHGGSGHRRNGCGLRRGSLRDAVCRRTCPFDPRLRPHRARRRRLGHLAPGAPRHRNRAPEAGGGRDDYLAHDDRGHRGDGGFGRCCARPLFSVASPGHRGHRLRRRAAPHHPRRRGCRTWGPIGPRHRAATLPGTGCARSGANATRAASPSSSSSP